VTTDTILRAIRAAGTPEEQGLATELWEFIVAKVKPGHEGMPISPVERDLVFGALHCLAESIECADELSPVHFEEVRGAR